MSPVSAAGDTPQPAWALLGDMDKRLGFMKDLVDPMRVAPGTPVRLSRDHDPAATAGLKRRDADARLDEASSRSPGTRTSSPPRVPSAC